MENVVDLVTEIDRFCDIVFEVGEFIRLDMLDVLCIACHKIIYTDDLMSFSEQQVAEV